MMSSSSLSCHSSSFLPCWKMMIIMMTTITWSPYSYCHGISFEPYRISYDTLLKSKSLEEEENDLEDTLYQALTTYGIISITNLPLHAHDAYQIMIQTQDACIQSIPSPNNNDNDDHDDDHHPPYKQVQTLMDGTIRHTIATKTIPSSLRNHQPQPQPFVFDPTTIPYSYDHHDDSNIPEEDEKDHPCIRFDHATSIFRTTTNHAIMAFTQHLSQYVRMTAATTVAASILTTTSRNDFETKDHAHPHPPHGALLHVIRDDTKENIDTNIVSSSMDTFYDIVQNGIHLEHFHSYVIPSSSESTNTTKTTTTTTTTIPFHTDQGLFLAFTPGRYARTGELTHGFYITIPTVNEDDDSHDETTTTTTTTQMVEVSFTQEDAIIIMLGDGVNQYINPMLSSSTKKLRAVPHSLQLLPFDDTTNTNNHHQYNHQNNNRIWYGVMILPPSHAIHPQNHVTFGQLRHGLIHDYDNYVHLACSNTGMDRINMYNNNDNNNIASVEQYRRQLQQEDDQCNNVDEIYCWHRCMNVTEYHVSNEYCDESFQIVACINPRYELWNGTLHGDYYPGCIDPNTAKNETSFPTLPNYPRTNDDNDICNTNFLTSFMNDDDSYTNSIHLDNGDGAIFQYTVIDTTTVMGRLIFNGIFGFLSIGFAGNNNNSSDSSSNSNAMFNGRVIVATRGDEFSPRYGLDLSLPNAIHEYIIDPMETSFRIWGQQPYTMPTTTESATLDVSNSNNHRQLQEYTITTDDCYTTLSFITDRIADQTFNVQGTDTMIWAANNKDAYMQYHGNNRGIFMVDWTATSAPTSTDTTSSSGMTMRMMHMHYNHVVWIGMTIFILMSSSIIGMF